MNTETNLIEFPNPTVPEKTEETIVETFAAPSAPELARIDLSEADQPVWKAISEKAELIVKEQMHLEEEFKKIEVAFRSGQQIIQRLDLLNARLDAVNLEASAFYWQKIAENGLKSEDWTLQPDGAMVKKVPGA